VRQLSTVILLRLLREVSTFDWPNDLIGQIQEVMQTPCNTPTAPEFNFKLRGEAAKHNEAILSKYIFNLRQALEANKDSLLGPRKEFKLTDVLSKVFGMHPLWPKFKSILEQGSNCRKPPINVPYKCTFGAPE
jgi:hypothetical protein